MNILATDRRAEILNCLVEGCSMRSTSRLTGAAKKTVERLLVAAGTACADYMDKAMRNLNCKVLQVDEVWSFKDFRIGILGSGFIVKECRLVAYRKAGFNPVAIA